MPRWWNGKCLPALIGRMFQSRYKLNKALHEEASKKV